MLVLLLPHISSLEIRQIPMSQVERVWETAWRIQAVYVVHLHSNLDSSRDLQRGIHIHKVQRRLYYHPRWDYLSKTYRVLHTNSQKVDIASSVFVQRSMGL